MSGPLTLVVGDKFADFSAVTNVLTLSQLHGLLALPPGMLMDQMRLALVPGQGLSDEDLHDIGERLDSSPLRDHFDLSLWHGRVPRAGRRLSHKNQPWNTLVSEPRRLDDGGFDLDLLVDERCEAMGDHQTGRHLQGMLLVEAARQAFLAVTEAFLLPENNGEFYFVFDRLVVDFKKFVFPCDVAMRCGIKEQTIEGSRRHFALDLSMRQAGAEVAFVTATFTVVKARGIGRIEAQMARDVLAQDLLLRRAPEPPVRGADIRAAE